MEKKMRKEIIDGINIGNVKIFSNRIDNAINTAKKDIVDQAKRYKNNTFSSQTGFVAESTHIGSFNIDSAFKRSSLKAVKEKNGFHGDYKILDKDKVIAKGEFKHYNNAKQTENAMRGYLDRELVGPKDQIEDVKKIAKRKALKNKKAEEQATEKAPAAKPEDAAKAAAEAAAAAAKAAGGDSTGSGESPSSDTKEVVK